MKRIDLFVIDGQNDFCASGNESFNSRRGALFVEGADQEAAAVAGLIDSLGTKISKIHPSLDSHHYNDGSHNVAWVLKDGSTPPPFTIVTHEDVKNQNIVPKFAIGVWEGTPIPSYQWALKYTQALESKGRAPLCLWPVHCQIGSWGQNIYEPLLEAYNRWCTSKQSWLDPISKGHWVWTEHYSALEADVPDPTRPETQINSNVIKDVANADVILWTGWAGSHCLRWTALDAFRYFDNILTSGQENEFIKKSVFFEDASAPVPDIPGSPVKFSEWRNDFLTEVKRRGATVTSIKNFSL